MSFGIGTNWSSLTREDFGIKKAGILSVMLALLICIAGCGMQQHDDLYDDESKIAGDDIYAKEGFSGLTTSPGVYEYSIASMSGTYTLWSFDNPDAGTEVILSLELEESNGGHAKLVQLDPDGTSTVVLEIFGDEGQSISRKVSLYDYSFTADIGKYRLKIVGKDGASISGLIKFNVGQAI